MSETSPFVGREAELTRLVELLNEAGQGRRRIVFIEGDSGMGKTALTEALPERAPTEPGLDSATFIFANCYGDATPQDAYQPFRQLLANVESGQRTVRGLAGELAAELFPDALGIVPTSGAALGASIKTATLVGEWMVASGGNAAEMAGSYAEKFLRAAQDAAKDSRPLVFVIEDAHWMDHASCRLLLGLTDEATDIGFVVALTHRPRRLDARAPFDRVKAELLAQGRATTIALGGLHVSDIRLYLLERFRGTMSPNLAAYLQRLTGGQPLFLIQYLNLLEGEKIIRQSGDRYVIDGDIHYLDGRWDLSGPLASFPIPGRVEAVLEKRIDRLVRDEREVLELAAVQGEQFSSLILAELLDDAEPDVRSRLRHVAERHRLITLCAGQIPDQGNSEVYAFDHDLLHDAFYARLTPRERAQYHRATAQILESRLSGEESAGRDLVLEIARHQSLGGEDLAAARNHFLAARSTFREGALVEAGRLCRQVFLNLKETPEGVGGREQLLAESVLLLLACLVDSAGGRAEQEKLLAMANLGEKAALAAGDAVILTEIRSLRARILVHLGDGPGARATLREALEQARVLDDPLIEAAALINLGSHLADEDMEASLAMRYEACDIYKQRLQPDGDRASLRRAFYTVMTSIGNHEFERGEFDKAAVMAKEAYDGLTDLKLTEDLHWTSNSLGQIYTAVGRFEEAEEILAGAIALRKAGAHPRPWHGYNVALMGKLYLEWGRLAEAAGSIAAGLRESKAAVQPDLRALVRNYQAELLMHRDYGDRDLYLAEEQLTQNVRETRASGLVGSAVTALSLRGQLALEQGRIDEALRDSGEAMRCIRDRGALPAVRLEELLYHHYLVLSAAGLSQGARRFLTAASVILHRKAASLADPKDRRRFLERIPTNRAIRHTMTEVAHQGQ